MKIIQNNFYKVKIGYKEKNTKKAVDTYQITEVKQFFAIKYNMLFPELFKV